MKAMRSVHDLIEEGKIRALWWALCIFAISYFLSHTSKSMWMNIPISVLIGLALHIVTNEVEFHWKVQPNRKQSYLSYLEKKQLSVNDSHLSAMPPPSKWKRKIDSPLVQAAVEEFIDKIVQDFVLDLWYSLITPDKEAPELIRGIILDALGEVAGRVKEVNLVDLLTRDIVDLIGDHIELFRRNQAAIGADIMVTLSSDERNERLTHQLMASKELHPALISSDSDYKFLQQLMSGLLAVVLRQREAQVPLVRCTAREILTCLILQPILNLVSPVYINELIEYILLSAKDILIRMDEIGLPHKEYDNDSLAARNVESGGDSTFRKHEIFHGQETDSTVVEMEKHGEKVGHASKGPSSNTSLAEPMQPRVAEWAQILDAATQRRTEVLAPENLENMWTIGRHYKDKINKDTKGLQMPLASDTIKNNAVSVMESRKEILTTNPKTSLGTASICHSPRKGHIPQVETSCNSGKKLSGDVDREATSHGASGPSYGPKDVNIVANDGNKTRLKGSRNTSDLRVELVEKDANTCESQELLLEDYHSPDSERYCGEHEFKSLSPLKIHAEGLHFPKLTCRVMGAFFEKIGSKSFAVYAIAVTDAQINTWFVERRYRNFERLHRNLKDIPNYTLHLPPKRIFSSSTEDAFVHQRCIQLDKYLRDLLSIPNVAEQHEVWDFLCASSKNYSFGKSPSVMKTLAVNVDDAVDDIVCQFKGVSDGFIHKVVGSSSTLPSMPVRNLSWHADDLPRHTSMPSPLKTTNSISDDEEGDKDHSHDHSTPANEWHSDNELNSKSFSRRVVKRFEDSGTTNPENQLVSEMKSECKHAGGVASLPVVSSIVEDPVEVPPEWIPPNVTVPVLNLVDKVFQLNKRGWIRRQVFWISKQILQLMMEDAIDDFLLRQIHWLRRDDVVAQGIRWLQDILWPEGKFFLDLEITGRISDLRQSDAASSRGSSRKTLRKSFPPDSFEAQLEAARRANDIKKMLFNGAPIALVSLVGHKQYTRCARDIFYFTQSSICIKQLAYGVLELVLISIFPELRDVVVDIHRKMRAQR